MPPQGKRRSALGVCAVAIAASVLALGAYFGSTAGTSANGIFRVDPAANSRILQEVGTEPPIAVPAVPAANQQESSVSSCGNPQTTCEGGEVCELVPDIDYGGTPVEASTLSGTCVPAPKSQPRQQVVPKVEGDMSRRRVAAGEVPIPAAAFGGPSASALTGVQVNQYNNALEKFTAASSVTWTFNVAESREYSVSYYLAGLNGGGSITLGFVKGTDCTELSENSPGYASLTDVYAGGYDRYNAYPAKDMSLEAGGAQDYTLCIRRTTGMMLLSVCVHDDETCNPGSRGTQEGLLAQGGFEEGSSWWTPFCATQMKRVKTGASGGPVSPRTGEYMLRFRAEQQACSGIKQTLNDPIPNRQYWVQAWVWIPKSATCITDFKSHNCPYMRFNADQTYDGIGTTHTATAGAWNAISGTMIDRTGGGIILSLENLPTGMDVYIDDIEIMSCTMEEFRAYAMPKIKALRQRDVQINIGALQAASVATITHTKHLYPFGAAVTANELQRYPVYRDFVLKNFNGLTDEVQGKWKEQEKQQGVFTWDRADYVADLARDNDMYYRGHGIFEEGDAQDWVRALPTDGGPGSAQEIMWERVNSYIDRYGDVLTNIDVINEITHFNTTFLILPCYPDVPGSPCICDSPVACPAELGLGPKTQLWQWAFTVTRYLLKAKGFGEKRLMQNDYCYHNYCGPQNALSTMVKATKWVGNDAYGLQGHMSLGERICGYDLMLRAEAATSAVPDTTVWLTEYDVNDSDPLGRANGYEMGYLAAYASPHITGLHLWGWAKLPGYLLKGQKPGQPGPPATFMTENQETMALNGAGQRIFGENGLLSKQFRSNSETPVPAAGAALKQRLFHGKYTLAVGGCTARFSVEPGDTPLTVTPADWQCAAGSVAPAAPVAVAPAIAAAPAVPAKRKPAPRRRRKPAKKVAKRAKPARKPAQ